jgi:hypothetical protein
MARFELYWEIKEKYAAAVAKQNRDFIITFQKGL